MIRVIKPILKTYPEFQELNNALKGTGVKLYTYSGNRPYCTCSPYYLIMLCLIDKSHVHQCRIGFHAVSAVRISPRMRSLIQRCTHKLSKEPLVIAELLQQHLGLKQPISD